MKQPLLILVDGSSYLYRAFHAMPSFTNSAGEPTGAIYGVVNMLRRLLEQYPQAEVVMVFDAKGKTFRDDLYKEYKANRPPMPSDLAAQIMPLHEIIEAMGIPLLCVPGVEADDVIGTLAVEQGGKGREVIISTGDKDLAQLVNEHVTLMNTMTDTCMDIAGVEEKFGIPPALIVDYLTLVGDTVDNIPGVPKVGPKTAVKWLKDYGSLDGVIANADKIGGKVGENLRDALNHLPLSRQLATIKCDVDLNLAKDHLQHKAPDRNTLIDAFRRFEFKTWLSQLLEKTESNASERTADVAAAERHYHTVSTEAQLDAWISKLQTAPLFAFDTETTSLDYMEAELVGLSFAVQAGEAAYVPLAHDEDAPQLDRQQVLDKLKPLLESTDKKIIGQNLKYDAHVLANYNIQLKAIAFDTMLESYVLDSVAVRHDMDSLALKYLGEKTISFEEIAGKGVKQKSFNQIDIATASEYAAEDADITLKLHQTLWPRLQQEDKLADVLSQIELPLLPVLLRMEHTGVLIDPEQLFAQSESMQQQINSIEQQCFQLAGEEFNLASPKQIGVILFEKMGLPIIQKTAKGAPSTAENVLQELAEQDYELPSLLLEHRSLAKLKSTYTDKLPQQINARTGRVHTSYHQAVAATGRLSSSDPNLQNIPIRSEQGRKIREAFVAPPGYKLVAADYSQIELRIMAHLSGDEELIRAFQHGEDIHRRTAARIFNVDADQVDSDQRRNAKAINFGLIYGMSAFGLGRQLGLDRNEAQKYMDEYFSNYPGVKQYMDDIRQFAKDKGYVSTVYGRRLYLPDIKSSNHQRRSYAERTAINAPMQGTAADIIKKAMIAVDAWLQESGFDARLIMQVHDELVLEVAEHKIEQLSSKLNELMVSAASLSVPLEVDIGVGDNWQQAH